ncbi:MAG TPA: hypothetical protein VNW72_09255 [Chthoniobacterales bacterium]|jgi:hypothetical protein|nr:hypothetical protein [Chthoniobacterales bacterium]
MARYERTHLVLAVVQTVALVAGLIVALCIGITQNKINGELLNLNFVPSVEVTYVSHDVHVTNKGKENIWMLGGRLDGVVDDDSKLVVLIAPGGFYFIPGDRFEKYLHQRVGEDGSTVVMWEMDIRAANGMQYIVTTRFVVTMSKGVPDVRTQTTSIVPSAINRN